MRRGAALFGIAALFAPRFASAHAFGQVYNLPLPVNYFIFGGVAAFIVSCAILLFFSEPVLTEKPSREISFKIPAFALIKKILQGVGVFALAFSLSLALFGPQDFTFNPLPD